MAKQTADLSSIGTIALQGRCFFGHQHLERVERLGSLSDSFLVKPFCDQLAMRNENTRAELALRYEGILRQIVSRTFRNPRLEDAIAVRHRTWLIMAWKIFTMSSRAEFATVLWLEIQKQVQLVAGSSLPPCVEALKKKFFLRQFLEEMPDGEQRGLLRVLAFDVNSSQVPVSDETLRLLNESYRTLHQTLIRQGAKLFDHTGGVWRPAELAAADESTYRTILFGRCDSEDYQI
jgi:hypothetical protein